MEVPSPTPPICFPAAATLQRQTSGGEFEAVAIANLTVGDMVKCLRAPMGPMTEEPQVGVCKYVSEGHIGSEDVVYEQIYYEENGIKKMLALSDNHMMWSSPDRTLQEGPVEGKDVNISDSMFVSAGTIQPNDIIIVMDAKSNLHYRKVTAHQVHTMSGLHNPSFLDGGMPFVNDVLATTSSVPFQGGHWANYYKRVWRQDAKFTDPRAEVIAYMKHPWFVNEKYGKILVDNDCFLVNILGDLKKGVDVTDYTNFTLFGEVYMAPCVTQKGQVD